MQSGEVPAIEMMEGLMLASLGFAFNYSGFLPIQLVFLLLFRLSETAFILRFIKCSTDGI